mgnify:CR=1 FL=1
MLCNKLGDTVIKSTFDLHTCNRGREEGYQEKVWKTKYQLDPPYEIDILCYVFILPMDYMISFPAKMKRLMGFVFTKLCSVFFSKSLRCCV